MTLYTKKTLEIQWQVDIDALPVDDHLSFEEYLDAFYLPVGDKYVHRDESSGYDENSDPEVSHWHEIADIQVEEFQKVQ